MNGSTTTDVISSQIGFNIEPVTDPTAPTAVVSAGGSVDTGNHYYYVSYVTAVGETHTIRPASSPTVTTAGNNTVTLTIPTSSDSRVTARKIYRTKAGASSYLDYLLTTINDNTTTSYVDTSADSTLTGSASAGYFRLNTTSKYLTIGGSNSILLDDKATYVGIKAGNAVTTGGRNTFIGSSAGLGLTTANDAVLIGYYAGTANMTGGGNTLVGSYAGGGITSGGSNTGVGYNGLGSLSTGANNVSLGSLALYSVTTTSGNIGIGYQAGRYISGGTVDNSTPSSSIYIGTNVRPAATGQTNQIIIGDSVTGNGSNTVTIGTSSTVRNFFQGVYNQPLKTISTSSTAGTTGDMCYDANYIYICVATNTWERVAIATW